MSIEQYLKELKDKYKTGQAGELAYRSPLETLIGSINNKVNFISEPKHRECGNPDCLISLDDLPLGYIETKDIDENLDNKNFTNQFERYRKALDNLIITDYLKFRFYNNYQLDEEIIIGILDGDKIIPQPENFSKLTQKLKDFCVHTPLSINSYQELAEKMANKAHLLRDSIEKILAIKKNSQVEQLFSFFKTNLIKTINESEFADIYAQTLSYGLFVARLQTQNSNEFSSEKIPYLIPESIPFLRQLFNQVAGINLDEMLKLPFDNLVVMLKHTNIAELVKDLSQDDQDASLYFYETFLFKYDPEKKKERGVYYTPQPAVSFIVRSLDELLKIEFDMEQGLADNSKIADEWKNRRK